MFGIHVIGNENAINLVILVNIQIIQIASVKKNKTDPIIEECTENDDETKLVNITLTENENNYKHSSCKVHIVHMTVNFTIFTGIIIYFVYYNWSFIKNKFFCIKSNAHKETIIW